MSDTRKETEWLMENMTLRAKIDRLEKQLNFMAARCDWLIHNDNGKRTGEWVKDYADDPRIRGKEFLVRYLYQRLDEEVIKEDAENKRIDAECGISPERAAQGGRRL